MIERKNVLITEEEILKRAKELGAQITEDFKGEDVLLVGILKGSIMWMSDLMRRIDLDIEIDFMALSSYGSSTKSSGVVKILKDLDSDIEGKNVIIVEDTVESGITLDYLRRYFENRGAKSMKVCVLVDKPEGRKIPLEADYVGFTAGSEFIIGYGLDYAQKYRNLPYVAYIESEKE